MNTMFNERDMKRKTFKYIKKQSDNFNLIKAEMPDQICLPLSIFKDEATLICDIDEYVKQGQVIAKIPKTKYKIISPLNGKVKKVEEIYLPNEKPSMCAIIEVDKNNNSYNTEINLHDANYNESKIVKTVESFAFNDFIKFKDNSTSKLIIDLRKKQKNNNLDFLILKEFTNQLIQGIKLLNLYLNKNIKFIILVEKSDYKSVNKFKNIVKTEGLDIVIRKKLFIKPIGAKTLDPQDLIELYESYKYNKVPNTRIIAVEGLSIKNPGYYIFYKGTMLKDLMPMCGGLKHTYDEIDDFKEQALIAYNDELMIKDDIKKEQNLEKQESLKKLLEKKQKEAKSNVYSKRYEFYKKMRLCLSSVIFENNNKLYKALMDKTPVHKNKAIYFLSNIEYKNKMKPKAIGQEEKQSKVKSKKN